MDLVALAKDELGLFSAMARYGDVTEIAIGPRRVVLLMHPGDMHRVLVGEARWMEATIVLARRWRERFGKCGSRRSKFGGAERFSLARSLGLVPLRGEPPLTLAQAKARLMSQVSDPLAGLESQADSLSLTAEQAARLQGISAALRDDLDSLITPLAEYVVQQGRKVKDAELRKRLAPLLRSTRQRMLVALRQGLALLTDEQRRKVPRLVSMAAQDSGS